MMSHEGKKELQYYLLTNQPGLSPNPHTPAATHSTTTYAPSTEQPFAAPFSSMEFLLACSPMVAVAQPNEFSLRHNNRSHNEEARNDVSSTLTKMRILRVPTKRTRDLGKYLYSGTECAYCAGRSENPENR